MLRVWKEGVFKSDSKASDLSDWWATFNRKIEHKKRSSLQWWYHGSTQLLLWHLFRSYYLYCWTVHTCFIYKEHQVAKTQSRQENMILHQNKFSDIIVMVIKARGSSPGCIFFPFPSHPLFLALSHSLLFFLIILKENSEWLFKDTKNWQRPNGH